MLRLLLSFTFLIGTAFAFQGMSPVAREPSKLYATPSRRDLLQKGLPSLAVLVASSQPASALVKGVAPPSTLKPGGGKPKCTNVEECQALAELKEQEEREAAEANRVPAQKTVSAQIEFILVE